MLYTDGKSGCLTFQARNIFLLPSTCSLHIAHLAMCGAHAWQEAKCPQGRNTTLTSLVKQILHISLSLRSSFSNFTSWSTWFPLFSLVSLSSSLSSSNLLGPFCRFLSPLPFLWSRFLSVLPLSPPVKLITNNQQNLVLYHCLSVWYQHYC